MRPSVISNRVPNRVNRYNSNMLKVILFFTYNVQNVITTQSFTFHRSPWPMESDLKRIGQSIGLEFSAVRLFKSPLGVCARACVRTFTSNRSNTKSMFANSNLTCNTEFTSVVAIVNTGQYRLGTRTN